MVAILKGKMTSDAVLLGTSLKLTKGQIVKLTPATNIPESWKFYAQPFDGNWSDGIEHNDEAILLDVDDFEIVRD